MLTPTAVNETLGNKELDQINRRLDRVDRSIQFIEERYNQDRSMLLLLIRSIGDQQIEDHKMIMNTIAKQKA